LEQYYNLWTIKCKTAYKKGTWKPVPTLTFPGNESISGTSCIPSIGLSASVNNKTPTAAAAKDKKRWGLFSKHKGQPPSPSSGSMPSPTTPNSSGSPAHRKLSMGPVPVSLGRATPSSSETLLCKPRDPATVDDEGCYSQHSSLLGSPPSTSASAPSFNVRLPNSVNKSMPKFILEVPTIQETLASTHLRRLFFGTFLEMRLGDEEKTQWNALCKFHADTVCLSDAELTSKQKSICESAMKLLDSYPQLPLHDELVKSIKESSYVVTSHFFFEAESKLYSQFHNNYQSFLLNNRWSPSNASPGPQPRHS